MNCAPGKPKDDLTCYSKEQLIKIAQTLNQHRKSNINYQNKNKNEIWEQIRHELFDECMFEWCWLDNEAIRKIDDKDLKENTFKPAMPAEWVDNKFTWLTTTDIYKVMRQYEKLYSNFRFFGPVPVDCPKDIYCELSDINLRKLNSRGVEYIGVVFNLDKHNESGSHWVGLFCNIPGKVISYYDSTAYAPPDYIKYFINMLARQFEKVEVNYNKKKHQFGGSECGIYSMNFIIESLKGKTMADFQKKNIKDFSVNILRNYFYRPPRRVSDSVALKIGGKRKTKNKKKNTK